MQPRFVLGVDVIGDMVHVPYSSCDKQTILTMKIKQLFSGAKITFNVITSSVANITFVVLG